MAAPIRNSVAAWCAVALLMTPAVDAQDRATTDDAALGRKVATILRERAGPGTRFGLVVTTLDGREVVTIAPDDRFVPASNTKIFSTTAAFARLGDPGAPDQATGTTVRVEGGARTPTVVLSGHGDARLSGADDCRTDCLSTLADAVAARTRVVGDVVGDDSAFADERWGPGWSWNNLESRSGTAVSALSIDDNVMTLAVRPGDRAGAPGRIEGPSYWTIVNRTTTGGTDRSDLHYRRLPNSDVVHVWGRVGAAGETLRLGLDDPAHYAAWRLAEMLRARGVRVRGEVRVRHRTPEADGAAAAVVQPVVAAEPLARLTPPPLAEVLETTSKISQNLYAELLLRRLGTISGGGTSAAGLRVITEMLDTAGVPRWAHDLSDGSGMSTYNRITPRAVATLLRWVSAQPWGEAWRRTLPIAGVDGTVASRFRGTPLEARLFAKTGTLSGTNALSGYLTAASGQTLVFSSFANDVPSSAPSATAAVDAALLAIAAER